MKYFLIVLSILITEFAFSQNKFDYLGTLILKNNTAISFSLELNEKNGVVSGYSITNINSQDETKSEINGLYFKNDNSFQLEETQILTTNSEADLNSFCYIKMNVSLKGKLGNKRLTGDFYGNFLDSSECASGKVILMQRKKIEKKIAKIKQKLERKKEDLLNKIELTKETIVLKEGDNFSINNWFSDKIILHIWDSNKEDGDRITLTINGNIILDKYETKNNRKKIKYKLNKGENIIGIKANNLGDSPPNTSQIELIDSKKKYSIITHLELKKEAVIKIIK